jgi:hypothetical protein
MGAAFGKGFLMPDAKQKIVIFYEASGKTAPTGWTETWWTGNSDPNGALEEAKAYVALRRNFLGQGAYVQSVRVSTIPIPPAVASRVAGLYFFQGTEGLPQQYTNSPDDDYDPTQVDLLLRVKAGNNAQRSWWMGGIPDSQTDQLKTQGTTAPFIQQVIQSQTVQKIISNGWMVRSQIKPHTNPATFQAFAITSVQPIMVRNRKRGRPFYLFRGRRLA